MFHLFLFIFGILIHKSRPITYNVLAAKGPNEPLQGSKTFPITMHLSKIFVIASTCDSWPLIILIASPTCPNKVHPIKKFWTPHSSYFLFLIVRVLAINKTNFFEWYYKNVEDSLMLTQLFVVAKILTMTRYQYRFSKKYIFSLIYQLI